MFGFFSFETQRNNSAVQGTGWYETPAFDALAPTGSQAARYLTYPGNTPSTAAQINATCTTAGLTEGVDCRTITGQGLNIGSPLTTGLGTQDLTYNGQGSPGVGAGLSATPDIAEYTTLNPTATVGDQYNGRLDVTASQKDHVAFAIYWVPYSSTSYNGNVRSYNLYHHSQTNDAFSGIWNHTFSPTFLNEARANAAGWRWDEINDNPQEPFGLPQDTIGPFGSITSFGTFGAPGPSVFDQWTYTYRDVATKVLGSHNIRFGGEVTRLYYLNENTGGARPNFTFYNVWDFLNDALEFEGGEFNPLTGTPTPNREDNREDLYGFFFQDNWKARPNLTLNLGLRYSYFGSLSSKENNLDTVRLGSGSAQFTNLTIQRGGGNLWTPQKANFGPEIGFAWSPERWHQHFVLRGGYGLNYNQEEIAISGSVSNNPGQTIYASLSSGGPTNINPFICYAVPADVHTVFGFPANPHAISSFNTANLPTVGNDTLYSFPNRLPTQYEQHFSVNTQTDLGHNVVFTAGYQGTLGHHLITQQNLNVLGAYQGAAFNPLVTQIFNFNNEGASSYNAALVDLHHQTGYHVTLNVDYTWSRSLDQGSSPYYMDPYPYDPSLAWGRSDYDVNQLFKVYGLYQPVFFHGHHNWAEKAVGGWSVSGILNLHSGFPWTPIYNSPNPYYYAQSSYSTVRPASYNRLGGGNHSNAALESGPRPGATTTPNVIFPLAAANFTGAEGPYFTAPPSPVPPAFPGLSFLPAPGLARNSFGGAGYRDVDATLSKAVGLPNTRVLGEDANIEIRADAINLFNITNLLTSSISNSIVAPNFGQA